MLVMMNGIGIYPKKTIIDYYMECGNSAHFITLAAILFLWILYLCAQRNSVRAGKVYYQLLLPCSILPIVIGVFGSAIGLYEILDFAQSPQAAYGDGGSYHTAEVLIPLVAGSFLTGVFLFLTMVTWFIRGSIAGKIEALAPH